MNSALNSKICRNHIAMTWLVKYVGTLLNLFHVDRDGRTAYQRRKDKSTHRVLVPFSDKLFYKQLPDKKAQLNKMMLGSRTECTNGLRQKSGVYFIGTPTGVVESRTIKRLPYEQRWDV